MDLIGWFIAPFGFALLLERGHRIAEWLIRISADALEEQNDLFYELWIADLAKVEGRAWKLLFGAGIALRILPLIIRRREGNAQESTPATNDKAPQVRTWSLEAQHLFISHALKLDETTLRAIRNSIVHSDFNWSDSDLAAANKALFALLALPELPAEDDPIWKALSPKPNPTDED